MRADNENEQFTSIAIDDRNLEKKTLIHMVEMLHHFTCDKEHPEVSVKSKDFCHGFSLAMEFILDSSMLPAFLTDRRFNFVVLRTIEYGLKEHAGGEAILLKETDLN